MPKSIFHKKTVAWICLCAFVLSSGTVFAQHYDPDQEIPKPTMMEKRVSKLGRGVTNFFFGWAEIPKAWHQGVQRQQPLTEIIGTNTIKGFTKAVIRMGGGVYETATFYWDTEKNAYEPIFEPEYLF